MKQELTQEELEEEREEVRYQILQIMKVMQIIAYITLLIVITSLFYNTIRYGLIGISILIIYSTWKLEKAIKQKQTEEDNKKRDEIQ